MLCHRLATPAGYLLTQYIHTYSKYIIVIHTYTIEPGHALRQHGVILDDPNSVTTLEIMRGPTHTTYIHTYIHTQLPHTLTDLSSTTAAADPAAGFLPCCFFSAAAFSSASRFFASFAIFSSSIACTHRHNYVHAYIHSVHTYIQILQ
jgi:hypothetical protein